VRQQWSRDRLSADQEEEDPHETRRPRLVGPDADASSGRSLLIAAQGLRGRTVGQIREGDRFFDLVVRLVEGARNDPDAVTRLPVRTERGLFPVGQLAGVREERGPNLVNRENGQRKDRRRR